MTWGPYVNCDPVRSPEEAERLEEERAARRTTRNLGFILLVLFAFAGLEQCAAIGDRVQCEAIVSVRRGG